MQDLIILKNSATDKFDLTKPSHLFALGFGSGLLKPAPGTWGTLAAVPLYLGLVHLVSPMSITYLAVVLLTFVLGVYVCGKAADDVGVHDHSAIVWDEFVGLFVTMIWVPPTLTNLLIGFLLFRLFDIVKPWPIKAFDQRVGGGTGIMIDDVLAGLAACAGLHLIQMAGLF